MLTITTDPVKGAILRIMIDAARDLNDAGPANGCGRDVNREYARGQAELICLTAGLSTDEYRDDVLAAITVPAPVTIVTRR